jgi:deoxyribose-phosphate aldolase
MTSTDLKAVAAKALACLDLTNLNDDCTPAAIEKLCADAQTKFGNTAAICIWPRFVTQAREILGAGSPIKIATVVNFPSGELPLETVIGETEQAIADGADEIDLVIPYKEFMIGQKASARLMIAAIRERCKAPVKLKTILETGNLDDEALIREASAIALKEGADFIKTSTGKVRVNATPEAARIMLEEIKASGKPAGFKPAGGVRTVADAAIYLGMADEIMGPGWAGPQTFRFGASGLLGDILAVLGDTPAKPNTAAY